MEADDESGLKVEGNPEEWLQISLKDFGEAEKEVGRGLFSPLVGIEEEKSWRQKEVDQELNSSLVKVKEEPWSHRESRSSWKDDRVDNQRRSSPVIDVFTRNRLGEKSYPVDRGQATLAALRSVQKPKFLPGVGRGMATSSARLSPDRRRDLGSFCASSSVARPERLEEIPGRRDSVAVDHGRLGEKTCLRTPMYYVARMAKGPREIVEETKRSGKSSETVRDLDQLRGKLRLQDPYELAEENRTFREIEKSHRLRGGSDDYGDPEGEESYRLRGGSSGYREEEDPEEYWRHRLMELSAMMTEAREMVGSLSLHPRQQHQLLETEPYLEQDRCSGKGVPRSVDRTEDVSVKHRSNGAGRSARFGAMPEERTFSRGRRHPADTVDRKNTKEDDNRRNDDSEENRPVQKFKSVGTEKVTKTGDSKGIRIKLEKYEGTTPVEAFITKFDVCSRCNKWEDQEKTDQLICALTESASQIIWDMGTQEDIIWRKIIEQLRVRFGFAKQTNLYRLKLGSYQQKAGETLAAVAQKIRRLMTLAWPGPLSEVKMALACDAFVRALIDRELAQKVREREPKDLEAAYKDAVRLAVYQKSRQ